MRELKKNEQYASEILIAMNNLINDEQNQAPCHISVEELSEGENLTEFFVGYLKAGTLMFNEFTGQEKNNLEFTHILNQLCVQDLLEDVERRKQC